MNADTASDKRERISFLVKQISEKGEISDEALNSAYEELMVLAEDLYEADQQLQKNYDELLNTQEQLEEERKRYRELFEFAPGALLITDMAGTIERANRAAEKMLGVRRDFLVGKPFNMFIEQKNWKAFFSLLKTVNSKMDLELELLPRSKAPIIVDAALETVYNALHEPVELRWLLRDVTEQRQAETEIMELYRRLQASGEAERLRLAQDLHDGPMQDLYGAVFQLELNTSTMEDPEIKSSIKEVGEALKRVAGDLRGICGELRPPTLANLGIERTIRSHLERIRDRHPEIEFKLDLDNESVPILQEMRLGLFRIYQQAMTNVLRHAEASRVEVRLRFEDSSVRLNIRDNGKGFQKPEKWLDFAREGHYGLAGIAERSQALGGEMQVDTAPGHGTHVQVKVPINT